MRYTAILITMAMLLSACKDNKPAADTAGAEANEATVETSVVTNESPVITYNDTDARMYGLNGKVKHVSSSVYSTYEDESQIKERQQLNYYEIAFDKWGHVTQDEWGNAYGYDADGNYYRGNHTYTVVKRDANGRIEQYVDQEPGQSKESDCTYKFSYSKNGNLIGINKAGMAGVWEETRDYNGSSIFPQSSITTVYYEGEEGECVTTISYKYNSKDHEGNWTDRTCIVTTATTAMEYDEETEQSQEKTETTNDIYIEKRTIEYYD